MSLLRSSSQSRSHRLAAVLGAPAPHHLGRLALAAPGVALGLGLAVALVAIAALHLHGVAALAMNVVVIAAFGLGLGRVVGALRARIVLLDAVRRAQDASGEGMVLSESRSSRVLHASPAAAAACGRTHEELVRDWGPGMVAASQRRQAEELTRLRAAGHHVPEAGLTELVSTGDEQRFLEYGSVPLDCDDGLLLSLVRDATPRVMGQRRLAEQHSFLEAVLDAAANPILVLAPDGRLLRVNPASARIAGLPAGDMTGRTLWDLGLLSRVQADDAFAALQASPDPHPVRAGWRARDGRDRTVAWTISAVRAGGSVRSAVAVGVDLTEQYAAEGRERRAKAALELRSHELARSSRDLAHFAMLATDELREPVRELERLAERLAHGPASARDDRLDAVRATASRTQGMLDGLADYGRLGQGEALAGDVDCERALDSALAALNAEIVARHADVTHDPLPTVAGDPDELRTLLSQLVASAVRQSGTSAPHVHVGAQRGRLGWELTVTGDRGGDRTRREFGVGMALCHRIVERHGGSLWADESPTGAKAYHVALPDRTRS